MSNDTKVNDCNTNKLILVVRPGVAGTACEWEAASLLYRRNVDHVVPVTTTGTLTAVTECLPRERLIGRLELLQACWNACGQNAPCNSGNSTMKQDEDANDGTTIPPSRTTCSTVATTQRQGHRCHCNDCQAVTAWAKLYLPRAFLRILSSSSSSNDNCSILISIQGQTVYPFEKCVCVIRGSSQEKQRLEQQQQQNQKEDGIKNTSKYMCTLHAGDVLRLHSPKSKDPPLDIICVMESTLLQKDVSTGHEGTNIAATDQEANAAKEQSDAIEGDGHTTECQTSTELKQLDSGIVLALAAKAMTETNSGKVLVTCQGDLREDADQLAKGQGFPETIGFVRNQKTSNATISSTGSNEERGTEEKNGTTHSNADYIANVSSADEQGLQHEKEKVPSANTLTKSLPIAVEENAAQDSRDSADHIAKRAARTTPPLSHATRVSLSSNVSNATTTLDSKKSSKFVLYLVPKGTDMTKTLLDGNATIEGLKSHVRQRGAVVLDQFDKNHPPWPTHFVVSDKLQNEHVLVQALGFDSVDDFAVFLSEHSICCVSRKWAQKGNKYHKPPLQEPTIMEQYLGIRPMTRKRKLSSEHDRRDGGKTQKLSSKQRGTTERSPVQHRNEQLSQLFHKLSKLHQECPLLETDDWRAYSFHLLSGRLKYLDFDVTNDPEVLKRLKNIKGFGNTSMQIIEEYLRSGSSSRVEEFQTNPKRVAMKRFMNIWGVGRVKASELVNSGYQNLEELKDAIDSGKVTLDRNQYIGLLCYDDILEDMTRNEVETISAIVSEAVHERFPSAEIQTMGSYRRGKELCGDADILIVHKEYQESVPPRALGQIVDGLRSRGHIAHHLTFISGMQPESFETLPSEVIPKLTNPRRFGRGRAKADKETKSSYMGVFNSPFHEGRKRRVDIKFYPYRTRVFASLYFTGNGHFNRSMRLWATRKFNFTLSDDGLFERETYIEVLKEPKDERDVFDRLGLVWKEPSERDCFDAVVGKTCGEPASKLKELSRHELQAEEAEHVWVD